MGEMDTLFDVSATKNETNLDDFEFTIIDAVTGSGYEQKVAELALHDGVAHRAARPNMQKFPALIVERKSDGAFVGFVTFQRNHKEQEFCFLQSAIWDDFISDELYLHMVEIALAQNCDDYPAFMTCSQKASLEKPEIFKAAGLETYLVKSGFEFMVKGGTVDGHKMPTDEYARLKMLVQQTETNVWNSLQKQWLNEKKWWNSLIDAAGEKYGVINPRWASRENCWMKDGGHLNLELDRKIELAERITDFDERSVGEYVKDHYLYFRDHYNTNPLDCCNLRGIEWKDYPEVKDASMDDYEQLHLFDDFESLIA